MQKSQIRNTRIVLKTVLKGEKVVVSHLQGIFSTTYNLKNRNEYGSYSTCIKKQTTCQTLGAKALNMVPVVVFNHRQQLFLFKN